MQRPSQTSLATGANLSDCSDDAASLAQKHNRGAGPARGAARPARLARHTGAGVGRERVAAGRGDGVGRARAQRGRLYRQRQLRARQARIVPARRGAGSGLGGRVSSRRGQLALPQRAVPASGQPMPALRGNNTARARVGRTQTHTGARQCDSPLPCGAVQAGRAAAQSAAVATGPAARLRGMSCAPAWPPSPEKRTRSAAGAAMAVTMPSDVPLASSSGPCSMCSCAGRRHEAAC